MGEFGKHRPSLPMHGNISTCNSESFVPVYNFSNNFEVYSVFNVLILKLVLFMY